MTNHVLSTGHELSHLTFSGTLGRRYCFITIVLMRKLRSWKFKFQKKGREKAGNILPYIKAIEIAVRKGTRDSEAMYRA